MAEQSHTEQSIRHTADQQNTGNHPRPGTPESEGADRLGGTRAGAENVEPTERKTGGESGTEQPGSMGQGSHIPGRIVERHVEGELREVTPERDERNRL